MSRILGFYDVLANFTTVDDRWKEIRASLAITRLVASALRYGRVDARTMGVARRCTARVADLTLHKRLQTIITTVARGAATERDHQAIACQVMAYGEELHLRGDYAMAIEMFTLVSDELNDVPLRLQALQGRGFAQRMLARFEDAAMTYDVWRTLARQAGDIGMMLRAELGIAKLLTDRGNLPAAEPMVRQIVGRALAIDDKPLLGLALIDLARIAGERRNPVRVVEYTRAALDHVDEDHCRERVMLNMAHGFRETRRPAPARYLAAHVRRRTKHTELRHLAAMLLYDLAIDAEDWKACEQLRKDLLAATMPAEILAELYWIVARHYATIGDPETATQHLRHMLDVAESHRLAEKTIRADEALAEVLKGEIPAKYSYRPKRRIPQRGNLALDRIESEVPELCRA